MMMDIPVMPSEFGVLENRPVDIGRHVVVVSGTIIMVDAEIGEGAVVGALSLASGKLDEGTIYSGNPAIDIRSRSRRYSVWKAN